MDDIRPIDTKRRGLLAAGLGLAVFAIVLAGWSFVSVPIRTGTLSGGVGCYTSGTSGELVADPVSGVAIIERGGRRVAVTWPPGWTARRSVLDVEIVTAAGDVHMRTGTHVELMGGYWQDGSFLTCGGRTDS